jgi:DNA polymerase III subunit delta
MNYLIISNFYHLQNDEIAKIWTNLDNILTINYPDSSIEEIITQANYISLFNDSKKILVKNANFFGKGSDIKLDKLEKYLSNPNPASSIIFLYNDVVDERKKIIKIFKDNNTYINIKNLNIKDINYKLMDISKKSDLKLSYDDANYITQASLNNYDLAYTQLEKVMLYYSPKSTILRSDIEQLISHSLDDNNFKFVDSVVNHNYKLSMAMLNDFKIQKVEPLALINLLAREYRNMLFAKDLASKNNSNQEIAKTLKLQDWQLDKTLKNAYNYSIKDLEAIIVSLTNLDYQLKTSQIDKYLGLKMFILK